MGLNGIVNELARPIISRDGFLPPLSLISGGGYSMAVEVHFRAGTRGGIVTAFAVDDEGFELWVGWSGCR